jgi:Rrf2 family protein
MKLSRTIAYAVHATYHLARSKPGVPIPCSQLAREGRMPERFLLQVLRKLVKHGLLESTCGVAGGYFLSRTPRQISLQDIVDALDNPIDLRLPMLECMAPSMRTQLVQTLFAVSQAARAELHKVTIADLAAAIERGDIPLNQQGDGFVPGQLTPIGTESYDAPIDPATIH